MADEPKAPVTPDEEVQDYLNRKGWADGWFALKDRLNSKVVSSSYVWLLVTPALAKVLRGTSEISFAGMTITLPLSLPFSTTALYFAAVSYALAHLNMLVFGPRFLFSGLNDFGRFEASGMGRPQLVIFGKEVNASLDRALSRVASKPGNKSLAERRQIFWEVHGSADVFMPKARQFSMVAIYVGYGLFGWVAIQNMAWVICSSIADFDAKWFKCLLQCTTGA